MPATSAALRDFCGTMRPMSSHYPIDPELQALSGFNAPLGKASAIAGQAVLGLLPKCIDRRTTAISTLTATASDGAEIRVYLLSPRDAAGETLPCLLYLHGGAFLHKAIPTQYRLMEHYALEARCRVAAVDYRLAPLHPYPTPVNDCLAGLRYVLEHTGEREIDPARMAIAGDSAGGSLTLDTWLAAKEQADVGTVPFAGHVPQSLMLVYPVVDHRGLTTSVRKFTDTPIWDGRKNRYMWELYLNGAEYTSPLQRAGEVADLGCAIVEVEEFDCLHDEGAEMARALAEVGVAAELRDNPGTYHGFEFHEGAAITKASVAARVDFLRRAFA
ncbi:MAG: alpha/beta hydrolase [Eggerthellaceae bacterium]|nr:alpha/beta hydrolase [Eggerthellaceae bacterium]